MNCKQCGAVLAADDKFCKNCGTPVEAAGAATEAAAPAGAVASEPVAAPTMVAGAAATDVVGAAPMAAGAGMAQPMMPAQKAPHEGNLKMIILGIVAVVAVVAAVLITVMVMSGDEKKPADNGGGSQSGVVTPVVSTHTVRYQGYSMEVPDEMITEDRGSYLAFTDESDEWFASMEIAEGSFANIKANKNQLPMIMQQGGYSCTTPEVKTLGGVEFVTTEMSAAGQTAAVGVAAAGSGEFLVLTVANLYNEADFGLIEKLAPVVKSMKKSSYANNITIDVRPGMSGFEEIAK